MNEATLSAFANGFVLMFGLIAALGPQNLLVLQQCAKRRGATAVLFCIVSDVLLIGVGVAVGGATLSDQAMRLFRFLAICYLVQLGITALRQDRGGSPIASGEDADGIRELCVVTWLNPHVYLDTVGLVGGVALQHGEYRWSVAFGASFASLLWFSALFVVGRVCERAFSGSALRYLQVLTGLGMFFVAWQLFPRCGECL